jgi:hypothetical protein
LRCTNYTIISDVERDGIYLAVVNVGLEGKEDIAVELPGEGALTDATTGEVLSRQDGKVTLTLHACQLRALRVRPGGAAGGSGG